MGKQIRIGRVAVVAGAVLAILAGCGGGGSSGNGTGPGGEVPTPFGDDEIVESFVDTITMDSGATDADWGQATLGSLQGQPVTSRLAYVYSYLEADSGIDSGRGQYVAFDTPLTGTDLVVNPPMPPAAQGRRVQWAFSDTQIGAGGTITAIAWGPDRNTTVAATYPNVRLRMGYQASSSLGLSPPFGTSFEGAPMTLFDGLYQVASSSVANTPGHPTTPHVGGYATNPGCGGAGTHNAPLFEFTGWYPWPTLMSYFDWSPGDSQVANDRVLVFDASVQAGDFTQKLRGWFAVTYPCSGILIAGRPKSRMISTYEGDAPNPADNFAAGFVNPEPSSTDMRFTVTRLKSIAQSRFMAGAYGDDTDYGDPAVVPAQQQNAATYLLEFQGADSVHADQVTIDTSQPFTDWTTDIDDCDGMKYIRFRFTLISDPNTNAVARIDGITIPMEDMNP